MKIYVIAEGVDGPCKIGFAVDPVARLAGLQTGNPRQLFLAYTLEVESGPDVERKAHYYAMHINHLRGEWFSISVEAAIAAVQRAAAFDPAPVADLLSLEVSD